MTEKPILIITADDLGLDEEVNRGIIEACRKGVVNSVSLLINGRAINDALEFLREEPSLAVGLHLNILRNKPLSRLKYLVDKEGYFLESGTRFLKKYCLNRQKALAEIRQEFEEQIERALSYGINLSHLNTEKHLHVLPAIFEVVVMLAVKYRIKVVRFPFERLSFSQRIKADNRQSLKISIASFFYRQNRRILEENHLPFIHFYGVSLTKKFSLENVVKILGNLSDGTHELNCHPGYRSRRQMSSFDLSREEELKVLTSPELRNFLKTQNISVTSFGALNR